jgi:hypothetical protein
VPASQRSKIETGEHRNVLPCKKFWEILKIQVSLLNGPRLWLKLGRSE